MGAQAQLEAIIPPGERATLKDETQQNRAVPPIDDPSVQTNSDALGLNVLPNGFQVAPIHSFALEKDDLLQKVWCPEIDASQSTSTASAEFQAKMKEDHKAGLEAIQAAINTQGEIDVDLYAQYADSIFAIDANTTIATLPQGIQDNIADIKAFLGAYQE